MISHGNFMIAKTRSEPSGASLPKVLGSAFDTAYGYTQWNKHCENPFPTCPEPGTQDANEVAEMPCLPRNQGKVRLPGPPGDRRAATKKGKGQPGLKNANTPRFQNRDFLLPTTPPRAFHSTQQQTITQVSPTFTTIHPHYLPNNRKHVYYSDRL